MTQAEIWMDLRLRAYSPGILFGGNEEEIEDWFDRSRAAVRPSTWWEPMISDSRDPRARITRCDFPDGSSLLTSETWRKESDCDLEWGYFLTWIPLPIQ